MPPFRSVVSVLVRFVRTVLSDLSELDASPAAVAPPR
jgi:hypothetical protein